MRRLACLGVLAVLLAIPVESTPPTPPVTVNVSGDAALGGTVLLDVKAQPFLIGRPLHLIVDSQVRIDGPISWTPSKDNLSHQWRLNVVAQGFWRAGLATEHGSLDPPCCIVAWSGSDTGYASRSHSARSTFADWRFPTVVTAKATAINQTWVRLEVTVATEDPRLDNVTLATTVHGKPGTAVTFPLPDRGMITTIHQVWTKDLPDPADSRLPPLRIGGMVACRSADLERTPDGDITVTLTRCLVATGIPAPSGAFSLLALGAAVALGAAGRSCRRP